MSDAAGLAVRKKESEDDGVIATCGPAALPLAHTHVQKRAEPLLLFVEGAAGEGKSHLLQEVADLAEAAEKTCLWWRCGTGGGPSPEDEHRRTPALWLVEDVHRADEDELRRLRRVLEALEPGSAAAVTYRPEELPVPALPLGGTPMTYPSRMTVLRYRLAPWNEERVRQAAVQALGEDWTPEALRRLYERTGGVPRVVVDLLAALRERRPAFTGTAAEVEAAGTPARLAELVLSRTYALSPADRPVVWAAAVLGRPAGRDELIAVSGLGATRGNAALLRALEGAALAELGEDRYGFAVPLEVPAVRASLPGPVRQDLHGRAAGVLSRGQPVAWDAVAGHRRAAGDSRGWLQAVEKAAESAAAASRHQHAVTLLEQTLATPGLPPPARARLAPLPARSAVTGLRSDQTVEVLTQIVRDSSLPSSVRGELRLDLGLMLGNQTGQYAEGWQALETAAAELREVRPDLAARAMAALSSPYWPGDSVDVHRGWLCDALDAADASGDESTRTAVLANRVTLATHCAEPDAWELVKELPRETTDPACARQAARGLCNAADAAVWLGLHERAEDLLAEGRDLSALYREAAAAYARLPRPYAQALAAEGAARCVLAAHTEAGPGPVAEGADMSAPAGTASFRTSVLSADTGSSRTSVLSAVTELESCAQRFTGLGAVWDAARTRTLLRTRQPAKKGRPPGRPSHADELSPREAEVAQLAASGLTNREIAATLHLSPRTVEQHIARAMRKTGAFSRRGLASRPGGGSSDSERPFVRQGQPSWHGEEELRS